MYDDDDDGDGADDCFDNDGNDDDDVIFQSFYYCLLSFSFFIPQGHPITCPKHDHVCFFVHNNEPSAWQQLYSQCS